MTTILVDTMSVLYKSRFALSGKNNGEMCTGGIYGFIQSIQRMKIIYKKDVEFVFLWDTSISIRKKIDPNYKKQRDGKRPSWYMDFLNIENPYLKKILKHFGIQYICKGYEADDLASHFVEKHISNNEQEKLVLMTGDQDWFVLVNDKHNVVAYYTRIKKELKESNVKKRFKINDVKSLKLYKILSGDSSDNVKGVYRLPKKEIIELINKVKNLKELLSYLNSIEKNKWHKKILEVEDRLYINEKLIGFLKIKNVIGAINYEKNNNMLIEYYRYLKFSDFRRELQRKRFFKKNGK